MLLLSLVGEQPIPILLVARALQPQQHILLHTDTTQRVAENLQRLLPNVQLERMADYNLPAAIERLRRLLTETDHVMLNLTGGTKPMALAMYEVARSHLVPFFYLQSEGKHSTLYSYTFMPDKSISQQSYQLPPLLTIDDYLIAHGLSIGHPQRKFANAQEAAIGSWFEKLVLEKKLDECRANLIFTAFEIDFLLRRGNQVAVVEAKSGKNSRQGIDQLNTIAGREYLGTYTAKIHIVYKRLGKQLSALAEARQIRVVAVNTVADPSSGKTRLDPASQEKLSRVLDSVLGCPQPENISSSPPLSDYLNFNPQHSET